jgi:hypothetical protein
VGDTVTVMFAFNRQTLPFRTDFFIAGRRCALSTNSHDILQAAVEWRPAERCTSAQSFEMEIIEDSSLDEGLDRLSYFRGLGHLVFALLEPGSFVTFDLRRKHMLGALSSAAARNHTFWNARLLPITIGVLGTTVGVAPLHCACLDRNGCGLLVAGPAGAGKSTLSVALAQRGFGFVSDDWTYISAEQSHLTAHGLSGPVKLLPDAARFFPELLAAKPRTTFNGELAFETDPALTFRVLVKPLSRPRWILFLERTTTPGCRFVPCKAEQVRDFFERGAERLPQELSSAISVRSEIIQDLSRCLCWILRTGDSPEQTAAAIDRFLPGVAYGAI